MHPAYSLKLKGMIKLSFICDYKTLMNYSKHKYQLLHLGRELEAPFIMSTMDIKHWRPFFGAERKETMTLPPPRENAKSEDGIKALMTFEYGSRKDGKKGQIIKWKYCINGLQVFWR